MPRVTDIEIVDDRTARSKLDEGFLHLKRLTARNRREDGSASREYPIDVIDRPTLDAVAVCVWARTPRGIEVLTRAGLRPAALMRRGRSTALPEKPYLLVEEIIAGVVEPGESGLAALQHRVAEEVLEEAALEVDPATVEPLGGALFMLPGIASEKIHLFAVEVARGSAPEVFDATGQGDGSPLEEGAILRWRNLAQAIALCARGDIEDAKTEVALRRLADKLARP